MACNTRHFSDEELATPSLMICAVLSLMYKQSSLRHSTSTHSKITDRASSNLPRQFMRPIRSNFRPFRASAIRWMLASVKCTSEKLRQLMHRSRLASLRSARTFSPEIHMYSPPFNMEDYLILQQAAMVRCNERLLMGMARPRWREDFFLGASFASNNRPCHGDITEINRRCARPPAK